MTWAIGIGAIGEIVLLIVFLHRRDSVKEDIDSFIGFFGMYWDDADEEEGEE